MNKIINLNPKEINHVSGGDNVEKNENTMSEDKSSYDKKKGMTIGTVIAIMVPSLFISFCCALIGVAFALHKNFANDDRR